MKDAQHSRRDLLRLAASLPFAVRSECASPEILPGLELIRGAVNTPVFRRGRKLLLIDSGDLTAAPGEGLIEWVLFTHHHPDQCSGAPRLAAGGAKVAVPAAERHFFEDARGVWESAERLL